MRIARLAVLGLAATLVASVSAVPQHPHQDKIDRANGVVADFSHSDENLTAWFANAVGYAVFPNVGKGGFGIGGAHGTGVLFEKGLPTGETELVQVTIGLQLGGQSFAEVIFFEDEYSLGNFKKGNFEMSAQVSAVVVTLGASADTNYEKGVAVFTRAKGGLMYEATVGGQKFSYDAWE
jgi:lipid-binding SYLF domain-containing protein